MSNYTLPSTTRISRVNRTLGSSTFLQASPFSGGVQSQDWGGSWWEYDLDFDVTQDTEGKALSAFLTRLRGSANTFTFRDPSINNKFQPGTILVKGTGQTGKTLITDGWSGAGTLLDAGDFISLGSGADARLYQVVEPVIANSEKNVIQYSADFSNVVWSSVGLVGGGGGFNSVLAGEDASQFRSDGSLTSPQVVQSCGKFSNSSETATFVVERQTTLLAPKTQLRIRDNTAAFWVSIVEITWSTLSAVLTSGSGTVSLEDLGTGPNGGEIVRLSVSYTGIPGNNRSFVYLPVGLVTLGVSNQATIIHWAQLEEAPTYSGSVEVTEALSDENTLSIEPALRSSPADNAVVEVVDPIVALRPLQAVPNSVTTPINYSFTMQARENI